MADSLAAKIGIGQADRRDPVGVRVRSPSQKTPQNNSLSPQRSVNQRRQAPAHGSVSESQNCGMCSRGARSRTRCGSCPISLRLDVGRLFGGLSGSIAGVTWLTDIWAYGSAALV